MIFEAISPSKEKIKVVVEGDRITLLMTSVDGCIFDCCDNRPPETTTSSHPHTSCSDPEPMDSQADLHLASEQ